jgi:hypothetical protein
MPLQFILTDLNGNVHGEVTQADSRKLSLPHLRLYNASFTIPITDTLAPTVMDTDTLLKVYRIDTIAATKALAFHGPVVSAEESADGTSNTIAVTAADPMWRLTKRLIPGSLLKPPTSYGSAGAPLDLGQVAHMILSDVNGVTNGYTGISVGTRTASISGFYPSPPLKVAAEAIAELHAGLNSFEYQLAFTEPTNVAGQGGWPQIATLNIAPLIGQNRPDAVFEYGTTRANVASYSKQVSREGMLNRALVSVNGWPDGTTKSLADRSDATSIAARGLFDGPQVPDAGVTDDNLRNAIGDYHVLIRKQPRQIITFRPANGAALRPLIDYYVGDTVRARAVVNGTVKFDASFRIWGISFDVDKNGNETVELELVTP